MPRIIKSLPQDFVLDSIRDVSMPTSTVFAETHFRNLAKLARMNFGAIFLRVMDGQTEIYRSTKLYKEFSKKIALGCVKRGSFSSEIKDKLIFYTKWFDKFIKTHRSLSEFKKDGEKFFEYFLDFFAYHQAAYFAGEYLHNFRPRQKSIIKKLDYAYSYNEMVAPKLEQYFKKLRIQEYTPSQILGTSPKTEIYSGVLCTPAATIFLSFEDAESLAQQIKARQKKSLDRVGPLKGLGVGGGVYKGKVRLIDNLKDLGNVCKGEVLVAFITRPQYNDKIRLAGAIVTDQGGLLSHPSILAREYHIPAVVGVGNATIVLKNGEMVEVDANKGIVRRV